MSERFSALQTWVAGALHRPTADLELAAADASFRRYYRVYHAHTSFIVMDAPPEHENCRAFVQVGGLLRAAGLHAPEVFAEDLERGFLLLSDLGRQSYLDVLTSGNADALFAPVLAALVRWQGASYSGVLPLYDRALLRRELELFPEWYLARHCGLRLAADEQAVLEHTFRLLEGSALAEPQVFVHRDYMPRNLMLSSPNPGVLDFQDALYGPLSYDVATLFRDAFISWDAERIAVWRRQYHERARRAGLPVPDFAEFERACDWMGMHRHFKVLGIFARLWHRDGKPKYFKDTPRFVRYLREAGVRYPEFTPFLKLLDALERRVPDTQVAEPGGSPAIAPGRRS
ncbi:MAG: aminoglycoside phosphotransferase family protein [Gammaproteobacteria bacterium]